MSPTFQALGIDKLNFNQRFELAEEILESIPENELPTPHWHLEELARREAIHFANPTAGTPVDQAIREIREERAARLRGVMHHA